MKKGSYMIQIHVIINRHLLNFSSLYIHIIYVYIMKKSSTDVCLLLHEFVSYKILDLISYEMCSCIESKFPYSSNLAPLPL